MAKPSKSRKVVPMKQSGTPLPGRPVRGSESGRPIMAALNLLSRRWVLRILWELRKEPRGFREMRVLCDGMSPNTLSTRLAELKEAGIVAHDEDSNWALTPLGRKLGPALRALAKWSDEWADAVERGAIG
jgi:DNA-binding HxlR family transcriptional regulator